MGLIPHPTEVRYVQADKSLHLVFSDDYTCQFPTSFLRGFCPCAHCQGHGGGPPRWRRLQSPKSDEVEDVTSVGNYGMCIVWGDGHDTGIFAFEFLRSLQIPKSFDASTMKEGTLLDLEHP